MRSNKLRPVVAAGGLGLIVALLTHGSALAQGASSASEEGSLQLEEVTVTARKVEENLMVVPLAITALTASDIEATGIKQLTDIMMMTPSFYFANQQGSSGRNDRAATSLNFRGLYLNLNTGLQSGGQLFIDGAPVSSAQPPPISDVERVEVLKGPQSAYFGRSTFVGAINFVTREPNTDDFSGRVSVEGSSFDSYEANLSIEGPLTDWIAGRLSYRYFDRGGYYRNAADPDGKRLGAQSTNSFSGTLVMRPNDALKIKSYVNYYVDNDGPPAQGTLLQDNFNGRPQLDGSCPSFAQLPPGTPSPGNPNGGAVAPLTTRPLQGYYCGTIPEVDELPPYLLSGDYDVTPLGTNNALFANPDFWYPFDPSFKKSAGLKRSAVQADLRVDYEFAGGYTLTSLSAYHEDRYQTILDLNYRSARGLTAFGVPDRVNPLFANPMFCASNAARCVPWMQALLLSQAQQEDASQELRLTSPQEQRLRWTAGLNYYYGRAPGGTVIGLLPSGPSFTAQVTRTTVRTPAAFGAVYFDLVENLTLSVEGRYQEDEITQLPLVVAPGVIATGAAATELSEKFSSFSPRVSLDWEYAPNSILYALFSRGFRPGGFNSAFLTFPPASAAFIQSQVPNAGLVYDEEQLDNYEVGLKSTWLDGRARTTLTVYKDEWTNGQVGSVVPVPGATNLVTITVNNGIADLQGVEFEGKFQLTRGLSLGASYALNDTEVKKFGTSPGGLPACADCNFVYGSFDGVIGRELPTVPKTSWTVNADYSAQLNDRLGWFARADYMYQGEKTTDFSGFAKVGSRKNLNARIGVRGDNWSLEAFGNNLTDDKTMLSALLGVDVFQFLVPPARNGIRFSPPIPRSYGVRATYEF